MKQFKYTILNKDDISRITETLNDYVRAGEVKEEDRTLITSIFARPKFFHILEAENQNTLEQIRDTLRNNVSDTEQKDAIERLRKLSMGVWLETCNGFSINEDGNLEVQIDNEKISFSKEFKTHLDNKVDGITSTFYRQATLRQIERYFVMKANGLFEDDFKPQKIADIGSGTLISSAMMREILPNAKITAFEPGRISEKTRNIAGNKNIELHNTHFEEYEHEEKFDLIMLHFVLEHDKDEAKTLVKQALKHLSPNGKISIAVPNFDALHRKFESEAKLNRRDPETRLSFHDALSGHQIIFTIDELTQLIHEVQKETNDNQPIDAHTILPRPKAFNKIIGATSDNEILYKMEKEGHPEGKEKNGSVTVITIGKKSSYRTPNAGYNHPAFDSITPEGFEL